MGKKYVYNKQLMCSVVSLVYEFPTRSGQIWFRSGECCDMGGCINLFEAIDPNVTAIYTYSGDEPDTGYFKQNGKWEAMWLVPTASATKTSAETGDLGDFHKSVRQY